MGIFKWDINLRVRIIGETINGLLFWMFFPFMTIYFIGLFGDKLAGFLMMIPPILGVISTLYGGYAADKYGRKKMMVLSYGIRSVLLLIFAFSTSPWIDYLMFIGLSMMGSMYRPASMAMVADIVPVEERKAVFAMFYTAINSAVIFGPVLGGFFFFNYKQYLILTAAVTTFIIFAVMKKILYETLPETSKETAHTMNILSQINNYKVIFTDKLFFLYIVAGILISQVFMQFDVYLGAYLKKFFIPQTFSVFHLQLAMNGENMFSWLISENGLIIVLLTVLVTKLTHKWTDEKALIISSLLFGVSFWLMGFSTNIWYLLLLMVSFSIAELIRTPVIQNFITKIAPEDKRGQYLGASSLQFSVGRTIAPLAIFLSAFFKPIIIFSIIFIVAIISAILYRVMFNMYRRMNQHHIGIVNTATAIENSK